MHTFKLISRFYGELFIANFCVTLSCAFVIVTYGTRAHEVLGILFWYKIIALAVVFYLVTNRKKNELYYYQNLGISKITLGVATSVFDFLLAMVISVITLKLV